ncbi:MAG TPA: LacI family transcriptional regulator [Candidatus Paenibacillus intestinavium]|nr:LacI family transcriptional regulator [Candidatus Paenibacillus intestinavium]
MVTIYDIAKKANVSAMTVSRVINNTGRISEKTRKKVKLVMEELHYVPNQTARSLVLQQTHLIFLLITDITNPFFTTLSRGAEDAARKYGYKVLFGNSDEDLEKEKDYIQTILASRVDGVLITPTGDSSLTHLEMLQQHQVPFILLDREVPGIVCDIVVGDSRESGLTLTEHLIAKGHRHIAMINGSSTISSARHRLQGYRDALKLGDIPVVEDWILESGFGSNNQLDHIAAWLDSLPSPVTAIIAGNNVLAVQMITLLRQRGKRVPDDISVVCFDDLGPYSSVDPFMTVISQQAYQFGYLGMQTLIERIQDKETDQPWRKLVLPSELIERKSVLELE